jgi:hypothetical protein
MKNGNAGRFRNQGGAALILMMLVMILGTSWALVGAVNQVSRNTANEHRETGEALLLAKNALLGYLAQQALTSDVPGMFPCPEPLSNYGGVNEGVANSSCSSLPSIGRFPWKTLGIDKPLDGAGEALWYAVGPGVRSAPVNFATTGSLQFDGASNAAVAMIISPGRPLNTASSSDTAPSPCVKRDQSTGRVTSPLNASDFVECGNATLTAFVSSRNDSWGNDRVLSITAAEMLKAIEGAVADRIQRQVAPALNGSPSSTTGWYQVDSFTEWGTKFFPYASSWGNPTTNDSCGDYGVTEGLLPLASGDVTLGTGCSSRWTSATITKVSGTGTFSNNSCSVYTGTGTNAGKMLCQFRYNQSPVVEIVLTASNIAMGMRTAPSADDVTLPTQSSVPGSATPRNASLTLRTTSIVPSTGEGRLVLQVTPASRTSSTDATVYIPNPSDSYLLKSSGTGANTSNPDLYWFITNQWQRYTYYAISPAVTANPSGACTSSDVSNCLTLTNAETGTGNVNDKRLMLILSGRALAGKTQPSSSLGDYFELLNDQTATPADRIFQRGTVSTTFNDRPSVCPFQRQTSGTASVLCD